MQRLFAEGSGGQLGPYSMLNISGTYKGTWSLRSGNFSSKFPRLLEKTSGNVVFELTSSKTDIRGVHYVQGEVVLRDVSDLQMKMEGVYVWPFRQLRMVLSSALDSEMNRGEDFIQSSPYYLLSMFSSQVAQDSHRDYDRRKRKTCMSLDYRYFALFGDCLIKGCGINRLSQVFHYSSLSLNITIS
jgi:hypothetical protein